MVFCAVFTIFIAMFSIFCVVRTFCPLTDDCDIVCTGYARTTRVAHSRQTNNKGWYVNYYMNYTINAMNLISCNTYEHVLYRTKKYKSMEQALNVSIAMTHETIIKMYPTKTREMLDTLTFMIGIFLLIGIMLFSVNSESNTRIERRSLLNNT